MGGGPFLCPFFWVLVGAVSSWRVDLEILGLSIWGWVGRRDLFDFIPFKATWDSKWISHMLQFSLPGFCSGDWRQSHGWLKKTNKQDLIYLSCFPPLYLFCLFKGSFQVFLGPQVRVHHNSTTVHACTCVCVCIGLFVRMWVYVCSLNVYLTFVLFILNLG